MKYDYILEYLKLSQEEGDYARERETSKISIDEKWYNYLFLKNILAHRYNPDLPFPVVEKSDSIEMFDNCADPEKLEDQRKKAAQRLKCNFIRQSIGKIPVKPLSMKKQSELVGNYRYYLTAATPARENIRITQDPERLRVNIKSDDKEMTTTSYMKMLHTNYMVDQQNISSDTALSRNSSEGYVLSEEGIYLFAGDYVQEAQTGVYKPQFSVKFFDTETLEYIRTYEASPATNELKSLQNMLNGQVPINANLLPVLLAGFGFMPDMEIAKECSNEELVTLANELYANKDLFLEKYRNEDFSL